jgi:hypothetical protein
MATSPISAASLSQGVLQSGNPAQQQALQLLQNNLASGDLNGAQSAFQALQNVLQNSATAAGSSLSSNSQLSTDVAALGGAISGGNLSTAQSAFATVLGDLKNSPSQAQINEVNAAAQSVQLVEELLSTVNANSAASGSSDLTTSILEGVYGSQSGLNLFG